MARASAARSSSRLRALLRDVSPASASRSAAASRSTRSSMWEYRCGKSSGADAPKSTRQESRDSTLGARFPRSRRDTFVRLFEPRRCANSVCVRPHFLRSVRRYEGTRDDIPPLLRCALWGVRARTPISIGVKGITAERGVCYLAGNIVRHGDVGTTETVGERYTMRRHTVAVLLTATSWDTGSFVPTSPCLPDGAHNN